MIYFLEAGESGNIKIGFTDDDDAGVRIKPLQTGNDRHLKLLGTIPGTKDDEDTLHRRFAAFKVLDGAGKEWFRPVPELLTIIPQTGLPSCGPIEVIEQHVSVKVLTVGRKQFSKQMLKQLPVGDAIDWFGLTARVEKMIPVSVTLDVYFKSFELQSLVTCHPWGWIKGDYKHGLPAFRWVLFVHDGMLHRHREAEFMQHSSFHCVLGHDKAQRLNNIQDRIYALRDTLMGWRKKDQLFYGI